MGTHNRSEVVAVQRSPCAPLRKGKGKKKLKQDNIYSRLDTHILVAKEAVNSFHPYN
jgi:hypothetical protein